MLYFLVFFYFCFVFCFLSHNNDNKHNNNTTTTTTTTTNNNNNNKDNNNILEQKVYNSVTRSARGSQAECNFALVMNLFFYRFGIRSCLATSH